MSVLAQKNILIGVSGGIAAYKIPLLIRKLIKLNSNVKVVMTPSSKEFVRPLTFSRVSNIVVFSEFTSENSVLCVNFSSSESQKIFPTSLSCWVINNASASIW